MALQKCKECNKEVSSKAKNCPHCGVPVAGGTWSVSKWLFFLIALSFVISFAFSSTPKSDKKKAITKEDDIAQAHEFIGSLPLPCRSSVITIEDNDAVSIHIKCEKGNDKLDGVIQIKNGVVTKVR